MGITCVPVQARRTAVAGGKRLRLLPSPTYDVEASDPPSAVGPRSVSRHASVTFSLEYGPFAIVQEIATKVGLGHVLFTRLIRVTLRQVVREPLFWAHIPVLTFAVVPSLLLELGAAICGCGGAVVMILRPK